MFTGIVETVGTIVKVEEHDDTTSGGNGYSLTIGDAKLILTDCHLGDSICCNGVCLTVTQFDKDTFKVGLAPETLLRSNLEYLKVGDRINLERAMAANDRFGGHFVQGHVDTVATIVDIVRDLNSMRVTLQPRDTDIMKYIVEKGFIALDGTSLTITGVDEARNTFSVMLIAYTQDKVVLGSKAVGDYVNVEVDFLGKLVEKQISDVVKHRLLK